MVKRQPKLTGKKKSIEIEGKELQLTNLDKVFWPEDSYTKGDLINYYIHISPYILPHLKDRPLSLKRYPNGIYGKHFFQKEAGKYTPEWIKTIPVWTETKNKNINYIVCNDLATLVYLANLACISQNPWLSRTGSLSNPDFMSFDLDPSEGSKFSEVVEVALILKEILDGAGLKNFIKTTGASGMHIYVPLNPIYSYTEVRDYAKALAQNALGRNSRLITLERMIKNRGKKIYIDYLQNIEGKTLVSAYCLRARKGAPAGTPLDWDELNSSLDPKKFNINSIFDRLSEKGDVWKEALALRQKLPFPEERAA